MKKIVTIICVISIILTTVVFSVSAAEIGFDTMQNESSIVKKEEAEVVPEEDTVAPVEEVPEEDTVAPVEEVTEEDTIASVEETTKAETANPKKEFLTDSSYYGLYHGPHEVDTSYNPIAYEDLPPEVQAWLDAQEAELAKNKAEEEEANRKFYEEVLRNRYIDPLSKVRIQDTKRFLNAEIFSKAEKIIMEEVASISMKENTEIAQVSVTAEGKVVSDKEIALSEETLTKLAIYYYGTFEDYNTSIGKPYFNDLSLDEVQHYEDEGYWFFIFRLDPEKNLQKRASHWTVILKDNGELYGMGD